MSERQDYDVVVVGGGAAGLSAALVLGRARRSVLVVDGGTPRNAPADHMHGYLSRDGLPPLELLAEGRREVAGYGGEVVADEVVAVEPGFTVRLGSGRTVGARRLVVATGVTDELPDVSGVRERWGRDVLHCPYCHGYEVRDQPLGVLAGQPMSVHQALLASQWSADVVLFAHTEDPSRENRARLAARGVRVVEGKVARLRVDGDRLTAVELVSGEVVPRTAVFVAPRPRPNDGLLRALGCAVDEHDVVAVDPAGATSVPGVWAVGNVATPFAQVITSASQGAIAAARVNMDLIDEDIERRLR